MSVDATANLLAEAFLDYPIMTALAGPVEAQRRVLPFFFRCCTRHARSSGGVITVDGGATLWLDTQLGPTVGQSIRCGLVALPFRVGFDRVRRAALHEEAALAMLRDVERGRYGCIWFVGVTPSRHGQGIARRLVDLALAEMSARGISRCVLTTEREENVTIWSRCGFKVVAHKHVSATNLPLWLMAREIAAHVI